MGKKLSPVQSKDQVRVGDSVIFEKVEKWLQGEIAQHQEKLEEKRRIEREEQEKRRQEELKRATIEKFLEEVSSEVAKDEKFPCFVVTLKEVEAFIKGGSKGNSLSNPRSYWSKLISTHTKAIDKIEEKKSQEELGRLPEARQAFIKIL